MLVIILAEIWDFVVCLGLEEIDPIRRHEVGVFLILQRLRQMPVVQVLPPQGFLLKVQGLCQRTALCVPGVVDRLFRQNFRVPSPSTTGGPGHFVIPHGSLARD